MEVGKGGGRWRWNADAHLPGKDLLSFLRTVVFSFRSTLHHKWKAGLVWVGGVGREREREIPF